MRNRGRKKSDRPLEVILKAFKFLCFLSLEENYGRRNIPRRNHRGKFSFTLFRLSRAFFSCFVIFTDDPTTLTCSDTKRNTKRPFASKVLSEGINQRILLCVDKTANENTIIQFLNQRIVVSGSSPIDNR